MARERERERRTQTKRETDIHTYIHTQTERETERKVTAPCSHHLYLSQQVQELFNYFDKDKSGTISYDEFLVGLRVRKPITRVKRKVPRLSSTVIPFCVLQGELNERRRRLVDLAFGVIDVDKSGVRTSDSCLPSTLPAQL